MLNEQELDRIYQILSPFRIFSDPLCVGLEKIPERGPALFVGNHTLGGLFDSTVLCFELWKQRRIHLRGLGHHVHFKVPLWGPLLKQLGVVEGTRENCAQLMREGAFILVFPGGGREVAKRKGEKYQLIWKERLGFARMAIANNCPIIPLSAIGVEDALDIVFDANDFEESPLGALARLLKIPLPDDLMVPLFKGIGPTPVPRPERYYFRFSDPIPMAEYGSDPNDQAAAQRLRDRVKGEIEAGISELLLVQEQDPQRHLLDRVRQKLRPAKV